MGNLGPLEIGIILVIVIVLFGAKRLPDLGSSVGKSIKNFKSGMKEVQDSDTSDDEVSTSKSSTDVS